jgi:hypothetical protein
MAASMASREYRIAADVNAARRRGWQNPGVSTGRGLAMRWIVAACLMLALAWPAWAFDTYRFDARIVAVGDSTGRLVQAAGQPARIVQLENEYGAVVGERWEYDIDGKTVGFTIRNGKVERIDESR